MYCVLTILLFVCVSSASLNFEPANVKLEQPATTTSKKAPVKLSKAERKLARVIAVCRAKIEGGNPSLTYLNSLREYSKHGGKRFNRLLDHPLEGKILSDDMSREELVSCLIDEEKQEEFYRKEDKYYREKNRLSKTKNTSAENTSADAFLEDASPTTGEASPPSAPPPGDASMASATAVANTSLDSPLPPATAVTTRDSVSGGASTPIKARPPVDVLITSGLHDSHFTAATSTASTMIGTSGAVDYESAEYKLKKYPRKVPTTLTTPGICLKVVQESAGLRMWLQLISPSALLSSKNFLVELECLFLPIIRRKVRTSLSLPMLPMASNSNAATPSVENLISFVLCAIQPPSRTNSTNVTAMLKVDIVPEMEPLLLNLLAR